MKHVAMTDGAHLGGFDRYDIERAPIQRKELDFISLCRLPRDKLAGLEGSG
jgi:hypothetical protein